MFAEQFTVHNHTVYPAAKNMTCTDAFLHVMKLNQPQLVTTIPLRKAQFCKHPSSIKNIFDLYTLRNNISIPIILCIFNCASCNKTACPEVEMIEQERKDHFFLTVTNLQFSPHLGINPAIA